MTLFNEIAGNLLLFFLVFGMSATVDIHMLVAQLRNAKAILMGVFLQFAILPLCGFLVVKFFQLEYSVGISLLVVTSSPGGSYSNWWCSIFNADLALSVTMTAISTLLSVILMPMNLLIYCKYAYEADVVKSLDFNSLFIALTIVISAIGLGLFASAKIHSYKFNILANKVGNFAGVSLVAFSALMSNTGGETQIWEHSWQFYVGVMIPCCAGLLVANILTSFLRMKKPERVTLSVECCYQNVGIATSVALTMFKGDELSQAMAVPLYYGLLEAVILGIYCAIAWKAGWTKAPRKVSFWTMVTTSYEVLLDEHQNLTAVEVSLPKNVKDVNEKVKGDTIYVKYVEEDEEDEFQVVSCMCLDLPTHPKEASGYQLPEVPTTPVEEQVGGSAPPNIMARGKGKRGGGRGSGRRFAAQSAEEIEQRNARLAEFDAARAKRRAEAEEGSDDDGSVDSATRAAEREAMEVGRRVADMKVGDDDDEGEWVEKEYKARSAVEAIGMEVDNPNKQPAKMTKLKDMDGAGAAPMTRREREEKEKEAKAAAYRKRHEAGLTEEYKRDMAKLAEVKARREAAKAKAASENEASIQAEEERKKAAEAANAGSDSDDEKKSKKKKGKAAIPKIDKIAIKKMKPAQLKECLKERGLDIQGNAKALQARLLKYEQER